MKKLESINKNIFKSFEKNEISNIAAVIGGEEGNTHGGWDWRDPCTKRRKDPVTAACNDVYQIM